MQDLGALGGLPAGQTTKGTPVPPGSSIGACFQLALLAAGQGNDQEAGAYLRQVIAAMKGMVQPGGSDAGSGPTP